MLGCTQENNDVIIFFEGSEIKALKRRKIKGQYFNNTFPTVVAELEASVTDDISDLVTTEIDKDASGLVRRFELKMKRRVYNRLVENGKSSSHQGYRHVDLLDSSRLEYGSDKITYTALKELE
jgi:hypothetical protein